jgi:hypothetical protein
MLREVLESQFGGPIAPTKYVEQEFNYDPMNETIVKECQKTVSKEFLVVLYLKNVSQKKRCGMRGGVCYHISVQNNTY